MAAPAKLVPSVTTSGLSLPNMIMKALRAPHAAPVSSPTKMVGTRFTPWPSKVTITQDGRIRAVGILKSRIPPLIVTSDCATVTTPRTAIVNVTDSSVWWDRKSGR